jgi:manganese transport protein
VQDLTAETRKAAGAALSGRLTGVRKLLPFVGPAFIASVAYIDPGNFATNIQAGSQFGYRLLWVVLFANLAAMLFQSSRPSWASSPARVWPSSAASTSRDQSC